MLAQTLAVGIGGAIGAMARFGVGMAVLRVFGTGFPLGIIPVNVIGSFLMGLFVVVAAQRGFAHWSPFFMTGVLGGFTTFSAFSLEAYTLYERGDVGQAGLYVGLSVVVSIAALVVGVWLGRSLFA